MEKEVFNPHRMICCPIIRFNVYGFKPFWELMFHYFISEAQGVCGASMSGSVTTQFGWSWSAVFGPDRLVFIVSDVAAVVARWGAPRDL